MLRLRLRYEKRGPIRFTSHRDLMRVFRRAFASAEIPVCFSRGFNPHPRLSFGPSLRTGWEGCDEYMDALLDVPSEDLPTRCNRYLPDGLRILEAAPVDASVAKLAADVNGASYEVRLDEGNVFDLPESGGTPKPLLERVAKTTPPGDPSWEARVLEEFEAAVRERFAGNRERSGESILSGGRGIAAETEGQGCRGPAPFVIEIACDRLEDETGKTVKVQFLSTMHGGRSVFPEDILTPFLGEPTGYSNPIRVARTSLFVERGGRRVSPISRAALENRE